MAYNRSAMPFKDCGTWMRYAKGCRCRSCKDAWAGYIREQRRKRNGGRSPREKAVDREIAHAAETLPAVADSDADVQVTIGLAPLDYQILLAVQRASRKRRGEIIGELLREYGR